MAETDVIIATDVAHFVLFHPEDLVHRDDHPIAWYTYDFIYGKESAAGNLIAWGTGSDGGYRVRMTTETLHPDEEAAACEPWHFPYLARHGRIMIDNTDALPGVEQMSDPEEYMEQFWLPLENGAYRVSVYPIDRRENNDLPDYVVTFAKVQTLDGIPPSPTPPLLEPVKGRKAAPQASMEGEGSFLWPDRAPDSTSDLLGLKVKATTKAVPRFSTSLSVSEAIADAVYPSGFGKTRDQNAVLATALAVGQLGILAWPHGRRQLGEDLPQISLQGEALVRIERVTIGDFLPLVSVSLVAKPNMDATPDAIARLREALLGAFRHKRVPVGRFEEERVQSLQSAEAVTTWALHHVELPFDRRLALYASGAEQRIEGLLQVLQS